MRKNAYSNGFWGKIPTYLAILGVLGCLLVVSGCATLPKSLPVQDSVADSTRQEFKAMLHDQAQCPAAIDADVTVTVENLLWSGTLSGYLRAMAPDHLRFEGVNPFGLTEGILAVDGQSFTYLSVRDQQAYTGPLTAKELSRYAPDGLATYMSYYWLLGRIAPGSLGVGEVGLDQNGQGYWLDLYYAATGRQAKVLFNPDQHLVKRYLLLNDHGAITADLTYEYPRPTAAGAEQSPRPIPARTEKSPRPTAAGIEQNQSASPVVACQLPSKITISRPGNGSISLGFNKRYPTPSLDSAQFKLTPPAGYKRIEVQ
jgi:hypothetical protein